MAETGDRITAAPGGFRTVAQVWRWRIAASAVELRLQLVVAFALTAMLGAMLGAILWQCGGHLIYSLDDPYISLSLGWHLWHGHYGINAGEAASPSSSILYPLLLACFGWASWQEWVPLAVNSAAAVATGMLFASALCRMGIINRRDQIARGAVLVVMLCVAINTIGLVFVGLEHSLHALTSIAIVVGLARALREDRLPNYLVPAIVLAPLWRFEGVALSVLAIGGLALVGRWRAAALAAALVATTLAAYVAVMQHLGLPLLPSSVLAKSLAAEQIADGGAGLLVFPMTVLQDAFDRLTAEAWPVLLLIVIVTAHPLWQFARGRPDAGWSLGRAIVFAGVVAGALLAHMIFGAWGWFGRYEAYAVAIGIAASLVLWREAVGWLIAPRSSLFYTFMQRLGLGFALICFGFFYLVATIKTPAGAREIYEQQFQMHRFAVEFYRRPVGVNDLGWVSYRNPNYVLDLWGLGSEQAREARMSGQAGSNWMQRLAAAKHVGLVMIFDQWFAGEIPPEWQRLAELRTPHQVVAASDPARVAFYATSPTAVPDALAALYAFRPHLLPGTTLAIRDDSPPEAGSRR